MAAFFMLNSGILVGGGVETEVTKGDAKMICSVGQQSESLLAEIVHQITSQAVSALQQPSTSWTVEQKKQTSSSSLVLLS